MILPTSIHIEYPLYWKIGIAIFQYAIPITLASLAYWKIKILGFRIFISIMPFIIVYVMGWLPLAQYILVGILYALLFIRDYKINNKINQQRGIK